jgi:uncharacterized membrane protein YphA (DoxX/SURF4 family)
MMQMNNNLPIPALVVAARVFLGLCFIGDGILNLASSEVRIAYLDLAHASHIWNTLAALVYITGGLMLAANRFIMPAALLLGGMLITMTLILHTDYTPGTIGEFPAELRGEVNFKETVVHIAIVASLMLVVSLSIPEAKGTSAMTLGRGLLSAGRILLGLYFITNALWQWFYYDIRVEHIIATGGNPLMLPIVIGVQCFFGAGLVSGFRPRWFLPVLMLVITASTILVHGDLSPTAPYPPNVQIHQWFVKGAILAGLFLIFGLGNGSGEEDPRRQSV